MSARYSVIPVLVLIVVHLGIIEATKCYKCMSPGPKDTYDPKADTSESPHPLHPDCLQGSKDLPTCDGAHCHASLSENTEGGPLMIRTCMPNPRECGRDQVGSLVCSCVGDLCNNWDPATLQAKIPSSSSNSLLPLIVMMAVGAKMIALF